MLSLAVALSAAVCASAAAPSWLDEKVTVQAKHIPIAKYLDTLSAQAKINFIITEGTDKERVTAFLHDATVREALAVLKESKNLDYVQLAHTNTYIIGPKDSAALSAPIIIPEDKELEQKVTVRVKNVPIDEFFGTIAAQTKLNFVVDESLRGAKMTAFVQNVTVREALEIVMRLKGLTLKPMAAAKTYKMSRRK